MAPTIVPFLPILCQCNCNCNCNYVDNKCLFRLYCGVFTVLQKIRRRQLPVKIRYRENVFTVWELDE